MIFEGPRPACRALDSMMDQIGDPMVEMINSLDLPEKKRAEAISELEALLINVFGTRDGTVDKLRTHIYELHREVNA